MKISCHKKNLLYGVQVVQRAISSKSTIPILSGIMLKTREQSLILRATDLEVGIECIIPVEVEEEGSIVLPARYFTELVRKLPDGEIKISVDQRETEIIYSNSSFSIKGFAAEEFPVFPEVEGKSEFVLNTTLFKKLVRQVSFASSPDDSRPIFTGILIQIDNGYIKFVATDTHRLAYCQYPLDNAVIDNIEVIIPSKTLNEVSRIFSDDIEEVVIKIADSQVLFRGEGVTIVSRIIDGQFPSYRQVIPETYNYRIKADSKLFLESLERASVLPQDKDGYSVIRLEIDDNKLIINSNSEIGKVREELPIVIEGYGQPIPISFNARYITDVLKVIDANEIFFELTGSLSPGIIKPAESDEAIYLVLPMRI